MNWFQRNFKTIIYSSFLVPILTVAVVSISHVTQWYGISNPISWAIYLSIGIEIAALSALAAISARMGKKVYFPFGIVTLIQFIGNIFFAYQYIDINSTSFKDWVDMVDPLVSYLGVESGNIIGHKRFLALFAGGMLPLISLSFLHMLVKFEEEEKKKSETNLNGEKIDIDELSKVAGKLEAEMDTEIEKEKYKPSEEDIEKLDKFLKEVYSEPKVIINEDEPISLTEKELKKTEVNLSNQPKYKSNITHDDVKKLEETLSKKINIEPHQTPTSPKEMMITSEEDIINSIPPDDELSDWDDEIEAWDNTLLDGLQNEPTFNIDEPKIQTVVQSEPLKTDINRLTYLKRNE